jgi:hypothetical protein
LFLLFFFLRKEGAPVSGAQAGFSNARTGFFFTASRTEPWPATGAVFNLLTAGLAGEDAGLVLKTGINYIFVPHGTSFLPGTFVWPGIFLID